jgi:hypothetical protein
MANIKETKELVSWVCGLGNALGTSLEDGKISLTDLFKFVAVLNSSSAAFQGIDAIPTELKDVDEAEKNELLALVKAEFDIPQDSVEKYAEAGLVAASKLYDVYLLFKQLQEVKP